MPDHRQKNKDWSLPLAENGALQNWDMVQLALLMDIRDELQTLNRLLSCPNFVAIPRLLEAVRRNTARRRRKKK